jgi:5-keto 4-deoxyuronate isomerase
MYLQCKKNPAKLQIILKLQNNCNYAWIWAGVVAFLVDRRFDLYIKVHMFDKQNVFTMQEKPREGKKNLTTMRSPAPSFL